MAYYIAVSGKISLILIPQLWDRLYWQFHLPHFQENHPELHIAII